MSQKSQSRRSELKQELLNLIDIEFNIGTINKKLPVSEAFKNACMKADNRLNELIKAKPQDKSFYISVGFNLKWEMEEYFKSHK
jgi:hypothetical protein